MLIMGNYRKRRYIKSKISFEDYIPNRFRKEVETIETFRLSKGNKLREEDCFNSLIECFKDEEYIYATKCHGKKGFVTYENQGYLKAAEKITCELSDIFFVVYSEQKRQIKYFVMQNKIFHGDQTNHLKRFFGTMNQYVLLNKYLVFDYIRKKKGTNIPECNLLDNRGLYYSVATYGVFYRTQLGLWDMATFTAKNLYAETNDKPKYTLKRKIDYMPKLEGKGFNRADNLKEFCQALKNLEIGKPIDAFVAKAVICFLENQGCAEANNIKNVLEQSDVYYDYVDKDTYLTQSVNIECLSKAFVFINADGVDSSREETVYIY